MSGGLCLQCSREELLLLTMFSSVLKRAAELDGFAQCLADKEITMYGAAWCDALQERKSGVRLFFPPRTVCGMPTI